jgi:hypothetical protein
MEKPAGQKAIGADPSADAERMRVFACGTFTFGVGEPGAIWPNNIIATDTIVQASGVMSRAGQEVSHVVDEVDLEACKKLAQEVVRLMRDDDHLRDPEFTCAVQAFFSPGDKSKAPARSVSEELIRERFGGTIFPGATVKIEPVRLDAPWWLEKKAELVWETLPGPGDGTFSNWKEELEDWHCRERAVQWQFLIEWFMRRKEFYNVFVDTAYVEIGDFRKLPHLAAMQKTFEIRPSALPRLVVGLTAAGGLAGGIWVARDDYRFR